ncbi:MAG: hypothetical protein NC923_06095 [Candidatus Omnitrophica bacterium]|nr:hypothetical protein [Candidatus Omnitrophota bacterium]
MVQLSLAAEISEESPITVNGDTVEYSTEHNEVTATGNVEIDYKEAKLTCHKIKVNTLTKEAVAEGRARLEDKKGVIEGEKLIYNFQTKSGVIFDAQFRANPYFGRARTVEKLNSNEFLARYGYLSSCGLDRPHYRIGAKKIDMFPQDKVLIRSATFYLGQVPVITIPQYNHNLTEPLMHVWVMPGRRKDWGYYFLSAWRYNLANGVDARVYLDYRTRLGLAEGLGITYDTLNTLQLGKGDWKFYYTDEKPTRGIPAGLPSEFQRYLVRFRHQWDITPQTNLTIEAYKIRDEKRKKIDSTVSFLKDYFYREFERDSQPLSYAYLHHNFGFSSFDMITQYRINHWFDQLNKLPEARYTLPSIQIGQSPFYFENLTSAGNYNKKATTAPVTADNVTASRLDTFNKLSLPARISFIKISPFVANRQTLYDKGSNNQRLPVRTILYSGADLSTKFYRIFNVKTNFLGMDINGLRHIVTPTVSYAYNRTPTIPSTNIYQIDTVDAIGANNVVGLGLYNKLQTKRKGASLDFLNFRVTSSYVIKPKTGNKIGSNLSDVLFDLELIPYSWMQLYADATYNRSVAKSDPSYGTFSEVNYDLNFNMGKGRSLGIGQRYTRSSGNQITCGFNWRLNPKWALSIYERYEISHDAGLNKGLNEQQYTISRDLHCWILDVTYSVNQEGGHTVWFIFKLKAFPEGELAFKQQTYNKPRGGSADIR